ncbi:histidine kinase, partial [Streptomyces varsoviensis]
GEPLGFTPSLRMDGPLDTDVPESTAEHLLAVLAESLSNTARHAHAHRVDVVLAAGDETVLTVTDDGVGLGGSPPGGGLTNMRTRAELLGGTLETQTLADGGTRLIWRVPSPSA